MRIEKELDKGDILLIERIPIRETDDASSLHDTLAEVGATDKATGNG